MRIQLAVMVVLAAGASLDAAAKKVVDVYVNGRDNSEVLLGTGKTLASGMFEKIGVHINWHTGDLSGSGRHAISEAAFGIRTVEQAPKSASPGALASSRILDSFGTEITVYQDRVRQFLADHPSLAAVASGYVLAHELAHVMQGVARHSESGILKAQWSHDDFNQMILHKLAFTDLDVELIHRGLAFQVAGRQSADPAFGKK